MDSELPNRPKSLDLVSRFNVERGWRQKHTSTHLAMSMAIEVGELMECLQWLHPEEADDRIFQNLEFRGQVESELADIYIYLLSFVDRFGIDLDRITRQKVALNRERFPIP